MKIDSCRSTGAAAISALSLVAVAGMAVTGAMMLPSGSPQDDGLRAERVLPGGFVRDEIARRDSRFTEAEIAAMSKEDVWRELGPVFNCFDPDSTIDARKWFQHETGMRDGTNAQDDLGRYNANGRWTIFGTSRSEPIALTWSFAPDGLSIPPGVGEPTAPNELFARLDAQFGGNRALWIEQFQRSFDRWEEIGGTSYQRVTFGGNDWDDGASWGSGRSTNRRGDVRISMKPIDGGSNTLAYNSFPNNGDMVLDRQENWASSFSSFRFLRNVIMHEHGHGMGFAHICSDNAAWLMEPSLNTSFDGPQHDDIRAQHWNYGDQFEPNNNSGAASPVGALSSSTPIDVGTIPSPNVSGSSLVSLSGFSDDDWYSFTVAAPGFLSVVANPVGRFYEDANQNFNGSCGSAANIDSTAVGNLRLAVFDTNGSSTIALADETTSGNLESLSDVLLPAAGTYFVRVDTAFGIGQNQMYTLSLNFSDGCVDDSGCDDGDPCNGIETCVGGECIPGFIIDCNNNGIDDACDIADGFSLDCNENGVPDECDVVASPFTVSSPVFMNVGTGSEPVFAPSNLPLATGDVTVTGDSLANLFGFTTLVNLDGAFVATAFVPGGICEPLSTQFTIPEATWNAAIENDGIAELSVSFAGAGTVDPTACDGDSTLSWTITYNTIRSEDGNQNGIPDECEEIGGCGVADVTTDNTNPGDAGYGEPDGAVTVADLTYLVEFWLAGDLAVADLTTDGANPGDADYGVPDGTVTVADLTFFVEQWLAGCPE
ncbi:MAG: GC-type dockerin domain-anchored protein [Planctomycetota bacterium]